jgi:hypothetical protein
VTAFFGVAAAAGAWLCPAAPPATGLAFACQPTNGIAGAPLNPVVVQLCAVSNVSVASNNVPVTVSLSAGSFAGGTTTVNSDTNGRAAFTDLVIGTTGAYTLTAAASGIGAGLAPAASASISVEAFGFISPQGCALSAFLDSLKVEEYWANGVSVNWLTGSSGTPGGANMTAGTASHCSAFAAAVADLLGVYILRPPAASDLGLANNQSVWLATNQAGWTLQNMTNAQSLANLGNLVVASYYDSIPNASGHIAVLRPSARSISDVLVFGPEECQSGITNYNDTDVSTGFDQHSGAFPDGILFYSHIVTNPIVRVTPTLTLGGLTNGVFHTTVSATSGWQYALQSSPDLINWSNCVDYFNPNQSTNFLFTRPVNDPSASGAPIRFYRLQAP